MKRSHALACNVCATTISVGVLAVLAWHVPIMAIVSCILVVCDLAGSA